MKRSLFAITACLLPFVVQGMDYEIQLENEEVRVSKWKIMPGEEIGLHRNEYPRVVFATQGGTMMRIEEDGSTNELIFPGGVAVFLNADPIDQLHRGVNSSETPIEAFMVEIKKAK